MCARPTSSSRALLRVCTREPTHRKRLAAGALNFLWEIDHCRPFSGKNRSALGFFSVVLLWVGLNPSQITPLSPLEPEYLL